jgi:hypothetical protein
MANDFAIQAHHVFQFSKNVELLLQQRASRFEEAVTSANYSGDKAQVIMQLGEVEMRQLSSADWKNDTAWSDIEHFQRWVFPGDFALSLPVTNQDQLRMIPDPRSQYAEAVRAAYCRKVDDVIIAAALGEAKTGRYDSLTPTPFPTAQVIDCGGPLTVEKLIDAKEKLMAAGNSPDEPRYFACSEKQLSDLLKSTKVQSMDYNSIRALVKGELDTFLGFKFISTERLPLEASNRQCLAWVKSGLHFATWQKLDIKSDLRPDKNYVWQIYARATLGAARTEEKKVVRVDCAE